MGTVNTVLSQAALEAVQAHPIVDTRLSQAVVEVILPSSLTPPVGTPVTRLSQAVVEIISPRGASYNPNRSLVFDTESGRWHTDTRGFTAYYDEGTAGNLLAAKKTALVQLESGLLDTDEHGATSPIPLRYLSSFDDCGMAENDKVYADLVIDAQTHGAALTVAVVFNRDFSTSTPIGSVYTAPGDPAQQWTFALGADKLGLIGRSIAVLLEGLAPAAQPCLVNSITTHWYPDARKAHTWDTGWSDWGTPNVKQIDFLELDIDAPAGIKLELASNLASQANASYTAPATTGHTLLQVPVAKFGVDELHPDCFEGQLLRLAGTTDPNMVGADDSFTLPFKLYGARARYREIGVYVDGGNGEEWLTFPDPLGEVGLVKLARIVELDVATTASSTLDILTDLPDDAMATRVTHTWAASSRRTIRFRVSGATKGKLWQLQFKPAGILRLYHVRIYAKAMASNEEWHWYVIPLPDTNLLQQWKEFPVAA